MNAAVKWILGSLAALALLAGAFFVGGRVLNAPSTPAPTQVAPTESTGMVDFNCGEKHFSLIPPPAGAVYGCDQNGQPIFIMTTVEIPFTSTPEGPAAPIDTCAYNGDPIGPNMFTPTNVFVLDETVNYALKTVTSTFYFTSVPVQASINGQVHHNLWIYCTLDAANFGAQTEFAERFSEATMPGWAYGFTVSAPFGQ